MTPNARRKVIGSFVHGSVANALPHAIGAQLAFPGRQVISMSGDGGLGMLLGELLTLAMHDLPVKVVTFNDSCPARKCGPLVRRVPLENAVHGSGGFVILVDEVADDTMSAHSMSIDVGRNSDR